MKHNVTKQELALMKELSETKEALRRSRRLRISLESVINWRVNASIEERALRLFKISKWLEYMEWLKFSTEEQKEFWMEEYIKIITK